MEPSNQFSGARVKSDLARMCLPDANREPARNLAWVNSICVLFLVIGLVGAKSGRISLQTPPPLEEVAPVVIAPPTTPPPDEQPQTDNEDEQDKSDAPKVVVVTLPTPTINFSVPTAGNLLVPNAVAAAPPLRALSTIPEGAPARKLDTMTIYNTGWGGERPAPRPEDYPRLAISLAQEGIVVLLIAVDQDGKMLSVEIKKSSGHAILDRHARDWTYSHWKFDPGAGTRTFEAPFNYQLSRSRN